MTLTLVPVFSNTPVTISPLLESSRNNPALSNIFPGDILTVYVTEKINGKQYLLNLRDNTFSATSDIPLNIGEKIQVKVQNIQPQIILNIVDIQKQNIESKVSEKVRQWHINPESLIKLLSKLSEFTTDLKAGDLQLAISTKKVNTIIQLLNNIIYSSTSKDNQLFIKDFISRMGFMLESDLNAIATSELKQGTLNKILSDNLKVSLLSLSSAINEIMKDISKLEPQVITRLMNLSTFTSDVLKTIEARQTIIVLYQQNESGLFVQIPLALGKAFGQADIYITPDDKKAQGSKKFSSCSITIFMDLDYLGEIMIDASLREGRIRCIIKCESEEKKKLISESIEILKSALSTIGYGIEQIDCLKTSELASKKIQFREKHLLSSMDLINHYA